MQAGSALPATMLCGDRRAGPRTVVEQTSGFPSDERQQDGGNRQAPTRLPTIMTPASIDYLLEEQLRFLQVARESLLVKRHYQLYRWLQGDLQNLVPHQVLIAAWGDLSLGLMHFDVVSDLPGLRTGDLSLSDIAPFIRRLFQRWLDQGETPFALNGVDDIVIAGMAYGGKLRPTLRGMDSALVHGIRDERGRHDCLYVALHRNEMPEWSGRMFGMLLPYIDTALRQVSHLPIQSQLEEPDEIGEAMDTGLSNRESEIMEWVRKGKTNHEIGIILDISAFTVKNHLQRVFRKLDVANRAQAVATFPDHQRTPAVAMR